MAKLLCSGQTGVMKSGSKFSLFVVLAYLCIKHKDKVGMGLAEDEEMAGIEFVDIAGGPQWRCRLCLAPLRHSPLPHRGVPQCQWQAGLILDRALCHARGGDAAGPSRPYAHVDSRAPGLLVVVLFQPLCAFTPRHHPVGVSLRAFLALWLPACAAMPQPRLAACGWMALPLCLLVQSGPLRP